MDDKLYDSHTDADAGHYDSPADLLGELLKGGQELALAYVGQVTVMHKTNLNHKTTKQ